MRIKGGVPVVFVLMLPIRPLAIILFVNNMRIRSLDLSNYDAGWIGFNNIRAHVGIFRGYSSLTCQQ